MKPRAMLTLLPLLPALAFLPVENRGYLLVSEAR